MVPPTISTLKHPKNKLSLSLPFVFIMGLGGCGDDNIDPNNIGAPDSYEFTSTTQSGKSSVEYNQASTYLILVKELEHLIESEFLQTWGDTHSHTEVVSLLNRIYAGGTVSNYLDNLVATDLYSDNTSATEITGFSLTETSDYSQLSTDTNIKSWVPGVEIPLETEELIIWPNNLVTSAFTAIAGLAIDKDKTTQYENLKQDHLAIVMSLLRVGVPYFLISNHLVSDSKLTLDNTHPIDGNNYTQLEHNWDLAFGISGSTLNLKSLTSETVVQHHNKAWNNLDELLESKTDSLLYYAALLDANSQNSSSNFAKTIQQHLLNGRTIIKLMQAADADIQLLQSKLEEEQRLLLLELEKTIAALVMAQINDTYNLSSFTDTAIETSYFSAWSKLYVYSKILKLNPSKSISDQTLEELESVVHTSPNINLGSAKKFRAELLRVRDVLADEIKINRDTAANWIAVDL